jgi:DNA invertase Pin-like site-specific DNA recombinase
VGRVKKREFNDNGRAWALAVVSSNPQAETLPHQRKWAEDVAKNKGWRLVRVIEGVASGKSGPRKLVREILSDLRALEPEARPSWLLMIRTDRLGRGTVLESQIALNSILELGVRVFTRDDGEVKLDSAMDELFSAAKLAVARLENDVRADKVIGVIKRKRENGEAFGRSPYGFMRDGKADVVDPERAPIVKKAFEMRVAGVGLNAIGKQLATIAPAQRLKAPTEKHPDGEWTVHWTAHRVSMLLNNRAYVGPIISEATFVRSQRVAATLTNAPKSQDGPRRYNWPLTGALRCFCGSSMFGLPCGKQPWRYRYYACRSRWNHDDKLRMIRAERLEEQFVDLLGQLQASPTLIERYRKRGALSSSPKILERSLKEFMAKLAEADRRRDAAWDLHARGKVRSEDVQSRLDRISADRQEVQFQIAEVRDQLAVAREVSRRNDDVADLFKRAPAIFKRASEPDQRKLARAIAVELGGFRVNEKGILKIGRV